MNRRSASFLFLISLIYIPTCFSKHSNATQQQCGVWVGLSTLPGTGVGMFAGKDFQKGDLLLNVGDHVIPIVDLGRRKSDFFLWDEYTWAAHEGFQGTTTLGVKATCVASPGFGSTANSFMDFVNVDEDDETQYTVPDNMHRSRDPQIGAFTYHHSRNAYAQTDIQAGQELFNSYGDAWFLGRRKKIGTIPVSKDHEKAETLYKSFAEKLLSKFPQHTSVIQDMWDTFVTSPTKPWESGVFAAFPPKEDYQEMTRIGLKQLKQNRMVRSEEWLQKHAVCADNFYSGNSTIPKAGRGVFASRVLSKGSVVLPVPLIHIPDRSIFDMYQPKKLRDMGHKRDFTVKKQLLLNYCLGHAKSTMLLSPYGPVFNIINHNQTLANVRLQWAHPERSNHFPEMLEKPVSHFYNESSGKIAMEVVALRDIQPEEEIFLDYGDEWEIAWQQHLATWKPIEKAEEYVPATEMNKRKERLKTVFEQLDDPYPPNLEILFSEDFEFTGLWKNSGKTGHDKFVFKRGVASLTSCEILRFEVVNGTTAYAAVLGQKNETDKNVLIEQLPREAFSFGEKPYTADMLLPNVFRHPIHIPDYLFPEAWKNIDNKDGDTSDWR